MRREHSGAWILAATILGSAMAFIDGTAVNVALPILQRDLNASIGDLQWTVNGYTLFLASLMLVGGALGDVLGRRRMFIVGIAIFAVASVWAGLSPNVTSLVVARAVQGIGGAIFVPGSLSLIGACFDDEERGSAIGTWSAASALTTVAGPVLGGWLAEDFSWRWVFFINVPIALVVIVIAFARVPESKNENARRVDWLGGLLVTLGLAGVVFGLTQATDFGLSSAGVIVPLIAGVVLLFAFLIVESKVEAPMLPLGIFKSSSFSGANLLTLLLYAALGGLIFFVPLNLVQVQGYTSTEAGLAMLPFVALIAIVSRWAGGLVPRIGAKWPMTVGPLLVGIGFLLFARPGVEGTGLGTYFIYWFPAVFMAGLGMAVTVPPLVTVVLSAVDQRLSGLASGINNAIARAATLRAVAVFGLVASMLFGAALDEKSSERALPEEVVEYLDRERTKLAGIELPTDFSEQERVEARQVVNQSFVFAFRGVIFIVAGLAFASTVFALLMIEGGAGKEKRGS